MRKKYRDRYGEFMVEGRKLVEEAVLQKRTEIIIADEERADEFFGYGENIVFFSKGLFDDIAGTENSQGITAVVRKDDGRTVSVDPDDCILVLDMLQDPGNTGTVIRTAEAAGYRCILAVKGTADIYAPKVIRAAAGSILRMPVIHMDSEEEAAEYLCGLGKKIVCTAADAKTAYYDTELSRGIALVIGNEGHGVSQKMQDLSHLKVRIPMMGQTESLNAAVAAGILMYQKINR